MNPLQEYGLRDARQKAAGLTEQLSALAQPRRGPQLKLSRIISGLGYGSVSGEDREALQEAARGAGIEHPDMQRPFIPFAALASRDLQKAGTGAYLVGGEIPFVADILRPWSVVGRAGVTMLSRLQQDQLVPKVTAKTTVYWLSSETTQITPSQPTIGQVALSMKTAGALCVYSHQLALQSTAEEVVRRELLKTAATAVDQAVLNGSGASGQPLGVLNTPGISTQSGTTLNAGVRTMKKLVAEANAADERISYISTPAVRETLEGREIVTGSGRFVWEHDQVADRPAYVTTDMPAATMVCGAFENVLVGFWSEGFTLAVDPFTSFRSGLIQARVLVDVDLVITSSPAAFCVATSIT